MLRSRLSTIVFCLFSGTLFAQSAQFLEAPQYPTGMNPQAMAIGDFNGDGVLDLAIASSASNAVSVLLGKGDGTFNPAVNYPVDTAPQGIAVGDFYGDGHLDIAVTNWVSDTVSILRGNGDGTFQAKVDYATGNGPQGIVVGDFNGDGYLDLALTNTTDGTVGVFLNNGNGTFGAQVVYSVGTNPLALAAGKLGKNNSILDLVVANADSNSVSVLIGNGNGTFQAQTQYATASGPVSVALADFNGDGYLDIAVADEQGKAVSILLGKANGSFQAHVEYTTAAEPSALAVGDFNGDGNLDLAVSTPGSNSVSVLWGVGDGTFQGYVNCGTGDNPSAVVAGDFNNNGTTDVAVTNANDNTVSVILSNGNKTFQARMDYPTGQPPSGQQPSSAAAPAPYLIATADFNGDGYPDVAVVNSNCPSLPNCGAGTIAILLGNGDGTFQGPEQYSPGVESDPDSVAVADFNGDNIPDLAVANYATNKVSVLLGVGDGTFQPAVGFTVGTGPTSVATGDFNGDGKMDLVVTNFNSNTVSVLLGNGDGTFKAAVSYSVGNGPEAVAVGDFNGDNNLDLVVVNETDSTVSILLGNGDGTFQAPNTYSTGTLANSAVAIGDFNGDNKLDLAVADSPSQQVSVLLGNGDGTFQPFNTYPVGANPFSIVTADFNGDGKLDLALTSPLVDNSPPGNKVSLLLGNGDGTFGSPVLFGVGYLSYSAVVGDFNQSGTPDLVVANGGGDTVSVLLNTQGTTVTTVSSSNPSPFGQPVILKTTVAASASFGTPPTGTVTLKNGSTALAGGTLVDGQFISGPQSLPVGTYTLSAVYSGDSNFQPHTVEFTQAVQKAGTTTALISSANPSYPGQAITVTAAVTADTTGTPTGSVTFSDGTTPLGTSSLNSSGVATFSASTLIVGTHSITASYSGDNNYDTSTSPVLSQVVQKAATATALSAPASANLNQSVSFTATVTSGSPGTLSGTLTFMDGTTTLGASAVNASGVASFTTSTLAAGTHSISADYSGDSNFNASASQVVSLIVNAPNFSISASTPSPSTIAPGASTKATVTITGAGGMNPSALTLGCSITPAVSSPATCSFGAMSVANNTGTATLTITTVGPQAGLALPWGNHEKGIRLAVGLMIPAILFSGAGLMKPKRGKLLTLCFIAILFGACLFSAACGSGSSANSTPPASGTPAGTYSVTISGADGGVTHTAPSVSFTVQ